MPRPILHAKELPPTLTWRGSIVVAVLRLLLNENLVLVADLKTTSRWHQSGPRTGTGSNRTSTVVQLDSQLTAMLKLRQHSKYGPLFLRGARATVVAEIWELWKLLREIRKHRKASVTRKKVENFIIKNYGFNTNWKLGLYYFIPRCKEVPDWFQIWFQPDWKMISMNYWKEEIFLVIS